MDTNSQLRYKELMSNRVYLIDHFRKRFKERVSKGSGKALDFAKNSYLLGKDLEQVEDERMKAYLQKKSRGYTCKIYRGFVCWFWLNRAITVYRLPILNKKGDYNEEDN